MDREADAVAALGKVTKEKAVAWGEEHLPDETGGQAKAAVVVDGGVEGGVASPWNFQGRYAANGADEELAVSGGRRRPEKHL